MSDEFDMHDPLAAYYVVDTASSSSNSVENSLPPRWSTTTRQFLLEKHGEYTKGMCIIDRRGTDEEIGNVRAHDGVLPEDSKEFQDHLESQVQYDSNVGEGKGLSVEVVVKTPGPRVFEEFFMERVCRSGEL